MNLKRTNFWNRFLNAAISFRSSRNSVVPALSAGERRNAYRPFESTFVTAISLAATQACAGHAPHTPRSSHERSIQSTLHTIKPILNNPSLDSKLYRIVACFLETLVFSPNHEDDLVTQTHTEDDVEVGALAFSAESDFVFSHKVLEIVAEELSESTLLKGQRLDWRFHDDVASASRDRLRQEQVHDGDYKPSRVAGALWN